MDLYLHSDKKNQIHDSQKSYLHIRFFVSRKKTHLFLHDYMHSLQECYNGNFVQRVSL